MESEKIDKHVSSTAKLCGLNARMVRADLHRYLGVRNKKEILEKQKDDAHIFLLQIQQNCQDENFPK